ncbi:hybrid sensor histidine kinase/response regulator [Caulobacter endophyticus]|uniref:histidine kinase n=1 Tax=Caulobacter endophyticus TaxID=2172652 RepID=A0A2T9JGX0_9CAUL|nr:PAS domain-containing sensor histidine kinase [Caulobacter endophyticus]PVM82950.1 hybrid sensor histidine kinase/response regulator [Caulobacter endophyticus]
MVDRQRKLSERDSAERNRLLIDSIVDYAIYLVDADGMIATWNTGAALFKGYAAEEAIGRHFSIFYTEEDRARGMPARALETARSEGRFEAEGWRVRKDGSRFWTHVVIDPVFEHGEVIGFAKITRDVSARKAADKALYESEQRFQRLVQGVRDYAIYMLDPVGNVTNWNSGAETIKGYKAGEVLGRHFSMFYTPEDRAAGAPKAALARALEHGKFEGEAIRVRKDGQSFWAHVLIDPIRDEGGRLLGFAKVTRDITEKRRAQDEIERTREALAQAQKMEAIGRLTGGVAHDFNNLLTVIRSSAEFLQRADLAPRWGKYVEAIASASERAALLTSQLLAFARRQPLRPETFNAVARLEGLGQIIAASAGSSVQVRQSYEARELWVSADPGQFDTAIINMVVNARDAMPEGGGITIRAGRADGVPAVRGHAAAPGEFVAISLADTGTGMSIETLAQIFEPFFTTKPINRGTGLGLSQVYGFAKQSRGEVAVESREGEGSTFTLFLPRTSAGPVEAVRPEPEELVEPMRILLVEDNIEVGQFATGMLEEMGHAVTRVCDAQSALSALEAATGAFDLVFTDVVMPGTSGVDMAREVRERWPSLGIILTSGYSHVLADGAHGFPLLSKPYTLDSLLRALRKAR